MSVKGMIRRAIATSILLATLFWTIAIATCGEGAQSQAIIPEASEAKQRRVMDVDEMCKLLNNYIMVENRKSRLFARNNPN